MECSKRLPIAPSSTFALVYDENGKVQGNVSYDRYGVSVIWINAGQDELQVTQLELGSLDTDQFSFKVSLPSEIAATEGQTSVTIDTDPDNNLRPDTPVVCTNA